MLYVDSKIDKMSKEKEILNIIRKYALSDNVFFDKDSFKKWDYTPQFEQDASNCWFYSMCNNAYYNLNWDFKLDDLIEVKNLMRDYGFNMKDWWFPVLAGAFIAKYLSEKRGVEVRLFQIDFFKSTSKFSDLFKLWVVFGMNRINTPLLYTDAFDDGRVNQVYYEYQATWHHATNICYDPDKKLLKELWTWGNSKNNQFYYDILQFWMNIKSWAISPLFTFFGILEDE